MGNIQTCQSDLRFIDSGDNQNKPKQPKQRCDIHLTQFNETTLENEDDNSIIEKSDNGGYPLSKN